MTGTNGVKGKVIFLQSFFPMETRYHGEGQLVNLVRDLNKNGIDSTIAVLIPNPLFEKDMYHTLRHRFWKFIFSANHQIADLYRKVILGYSKKDFTKFKLFPIWNVCDLNHLKPIFVVTWDWESAYYLSKCNNASFRKIQVLHYHPFEEYFRDYVLDDRISKYVEAYYSDMIKVAISYEQIRDFDGRRVYHWLQGIDLDIFFRQKSSIGDPLKILIPLRKPKEKGALSALQAAEIISTHHREVSIESFGNYPFKIPSFIHHHGYVDFIELLDLYRRCDIFVLPSLNEGFSYPGLEAMASGCAVVSTRNGGSDQYIRDRYNGILVEPGDSLALANAVIELVENRELLKKIISNGQKTVLEYSNQKASERFIEILNKAYFNS